MLSRIVPMAVVLLSFAFAISTANAGLVVTLTQQGGLGNGTTKVLPGTPAAGPNAVVSESYLTLLGNAFSPDFSTVQVTILSSENPAGAFLTDLTLNLIRNAASPEIVRFIVSVVNDDMTLPNQPFVTLTSDFSTNVLLNQATGTFVSALNGQATDPITLTGAAAPATTSEIVAKNTTPYTLENTVTIDVGPNQSGSFQGATSVTAVPEIGSLATWGACLTIGAAAVWIRRRRS